MATHTRPFLMTGVALASAVAVVAATPSIMPSVAMPAPTALSSASFELTTFADLLSITPEDISNAYFNGWGLALKPFDDSDFDPDWAASFLGPFVGCNENCVQAGVSGIAYLALDALINGNGAGIKAVDGILQDPSKPYQPDPAKPDFNPYTTPPWSTSALNYAFEAGPGIALTYLVVQPFVVPTSPLYNPALASAIVFASNGLASLTSVYVGVLDAAAKLARDAVPLLGPYIYGAIQAYLGPASSDGPFEEAYFAGLSGILQYAIDVVLTGGNPYPPYGPPVTQPVTLPVIAASAAALVGAAVSAPEAVSLAESTPADESAAPESQATEDASSIDVPSAAVDTPAEAVAVDSPATPADLAAVEVSTAVDDVTASIPAADVAESAPAEASVTTSLRPVRGAAERAAKSIAAAIGGSTAANSDASASDDSAPDASASDDKGSDAPGSDASASDDKGSDDKSSNDKDSDDSAG